MGRATIRKQVLCVIMVWICGSSLAGAQAGDEGGTTTRDTLAYKNGDRLLGELVQRVGDVLVFKSDRFGELRVPAGDAVVIPAEKEAQVAPAVIQAPVATAAQVKQKAQEDRVSVWEWFSPLVLTAKVRRYFGPWHGKFGITAETVSDTTDRDNLGLDARLQRKWTNDEVQLNGRYTYSKTNTVTSTDLVKGGGLWRHNFTKKYFAAYRPTMEWNRFFIPKGGGARADYVLLQQEIGLGVNLYSKPAYEVRTGLSENIFTNWVIPTDNYVTQTVESAFLEVEAKLPWRMTLSDRSVYYYSFATGTDGFENKLELDKKFTETLSVGLRYEVRYNNPDVRSADQNLLRLVFGFDF